MVFLLVLTLTLILLTMGRTFDSYGLRDLVVMECLYGRRCFMMGGLQRSPFQALVALPQWSLSLLRKSRDRFDAATTKQARREILLKKKLWPNRL